MSGLQLHQLCLLKPALPVTNSVEVAEKERKTLQKLKSKEGKGLQGEEEQAETKGNHGASGRYSRLKYVGPDTSHGRRPLDRQIT